MNLFKFLLSLILIERKMRTLKISLLIFILPATLFAQRDNFFYSEKTLSAPFLIQTNDNPVQRLKQELNQIINKLNSTQWVNEYYLIDSLIAESVSGGKVKYLFQYNTNGKMIERTEFLKYTNSNWQLMDKDEYFYDTSNNLIREIHLSWDNAEWDSTTQILYEYNEDNKLILTTIQWYVTSNWENDSRETYSYDQAGNQINSLVELWQNNQWTNSSTLYNYYSPENRRDSLLLQKWDGNKWQNYWRTSFYYDSLTTFLKLAIAQLWTGNQFQDYLKLNITNDELGNQVQQLEQVWNGSIWVNDIKKDYTYLSNYFESCNAELWNGTNWELGDTPILVNNPDGFKIAIVIQSINIYYIIVNVESTNYNTPNDFSLSQNYPNPFNPSTKIKFTIPYVETHRDASLLTTLKVYDILGNEVATLVNEEKPAGSYNAQFTTNNVQLSSGIYFYKLQAGDFVETKKMILLK